MPLAKSTSGWKNGGMADLLVKLYRLPALAPALSRAAEAGATIRRALAPERYAVVNWVATHYGDRWAGEVSLAFSGHPISCFLAVAPEGQLIGFACYDTTFRGFFGPTGVLQEWGGRGIGTALLIRSLHALWESGYAYAIIGAVGPSAFYEQSVGAIPIPDSTPGPYEGLLPR